MIIIILISHIDPYRNKVYNHIKSWFKVKVSSCQQIHSEPLYLFYLLSLLIRRPVRFTDRPDVGNQRTEPAHCGFTAFTEVWICLPPPPRTWTWNIFLQLDSDVRDEWNSCSQQTELRWNSGILVCQQFCVFRGEFIDPEEQQSPEDQIRSTETPHHETNLTTSRRRDDSWD